MMENFENVKFGVFPGHPNLACELLKTNEMVIIIIEPWSTIDT